MTTATTSARSATLTTGHVGLNVSDLARSTDFYRAVFGFDLLHESREGAHRFAFLGRAARPVLTLWEQSSGAFATDRPGLHHLSFQVETVDEVRVYAERLRTLNAHFVYDGVVPHGEGHDSGGIFFTDPDGMRLEIFSPSGAGGVAAPSGVAPTCGFF